MATGEWDNASRQLRQTLDQSGTILGQILDDYIPAPVPKDPIERRLLVVLGNVVADLDNAAIATAQQLDLIATRVF